MLGRKKWGRDFTRPEVFYLFAFFYLLAGVVSVNDPAMLAVNPNLVISPLTILVWLLGLFFLFLGFRIGGKIFRLGPLPLAAGFIMGTIMLNTMFGMGWVLSIILNALALLGCWIILNLKHLVTRGFFRPLLLRLSPALTGRVYWEYLFLAGLAVFLINMAFIGTPLLNPALHEDMLSVLNLPFVFGFYLMLYSTIRFYQERRNPGRVFLFILLILSILSSFRSYIGIVFLAWLFLELGAGGRANPRKILPLVAVLVVALVSAVLIGQSLALSWKSEWALGPLRTVEYRFGFTNHVFDDVVKKAFPWGYSFGASLEKPFGLYTCQALYGCEGRLTSALPGEIMLDFGLPGIFIVMFFTGSVLKGLHKRDYPLYALFMAHLIVALEISAGYFFILIFAYLGYLGGWKRS